MYRFVDVFTRLLQSVHFDHRNVPRVQLDLGSSNTRLMVNSKKVFDQPTLVAFHPITGNVIAIGNNAQEMKGKTPPTVKITTPVRRGRILDEEAMQHFLTALLQMYLPHKGSVYPFFQMNIHVATSSFISQAEKETLRKVLRQLGYAKVVFTTEDRVAFAHLNSRRRMPNVSALVVIGGMTTEICFFNHGERVAQKVLPIGGEDFTKAVLRVLRKRYHCEVSWQSAEKVKKQIGRVAVEQNQFKQSVVRGRDVLTSLPTTVSVSFEKCEEEFMDLARDILTGIQELCQDVQPQIVAEAFESGIFLSGGGAMLEGLAEFLEHQLQTPVMLSSTASDDVIFGLCLIH